MANYYSSFTMPISESDVPPNVSSLGDLAPLYKEGMTLHTYSRRNWLRYAIEKCVSHYGFVRLNYLANEATVLAPKDVGLAAEQLSSLLRTIELSPETLVHIFGQDAWSAQELTDILQSPASPCGSVPRCDDGDDLPYLLSALKSHLALLQYANIKGLHVVHAQQQ